MVSETGCEEEEKPDTCDIKMVSEDIKGLWHEDSEKRLWHEGIQLYSKFCTFKQTRLYTRSSTHSLIQGTDYDVKRFPSYAFFFPCTPSISNCKM